MGYRVRNEHGELRFNSLSELREAWQQQFVGPDDEVLEDGSTTWRKAATLPKLVAVQKEKVPFWRGEARWYLMAIALVGAGIYFVLYGWSMVSFAIVAALFAFFLVWTTAASTRKRR